MFVPFCPPEKTNTCAHPSRKTNQKARCGILFLAMPDVIKLGGVEPVGTTGAWFHCSAEQLRRAVSWDLQGT